MIGELNTNSQHESDHGTPAPPPVATYLVGLGGFASKHLQQIREHAAKGEMVFAGCMPTGIARDHARVEELRNADVPLFGSYDELLSHASTRHGGANGPGLVVLQLPIHLHVEFAIQALRAGLHVLCEKPLTGDRSEAERLAKVEEETGYRVAVGFQHVYSSQIQRVKELVADGALGSFVDGRALALWPRNRAYYERNSWAGLLRVDGRPILDSPGQNANAHVLQNLLYLAGGSRWATASVEEVYAEQYRANAIQSADTQAIRVRLGQTAGNDPASKPEFDAASPSASDMQSRPPEILFLATHACSCNFGPVIDLRFTNGRVLWRMGEGGRTRIRVRRGSILEPAREFLQDDVFTEEYQSILHALRSGTAFLVGTRNASQHVEVMSRSFEHQVIFQVPESHCTSRGKTDSAVTIPGIEEDAFSAFRERRTFREIAAAWAIAARP